MSRQNPTRVDAASKRAANPWLEALMARPPGSSVWGGPPRILFTWLIVHKCFGPQPPGCDGCPGGSTGPEQRRPPPPAPTLPPLPSTPSVPSTASGRPVSFNVPTDGIQRERERERESEERDDEDPEHSCGPDRDLETTSSSSSSSSSVVVQGLEGLEFEHS